MLCRLGKGCTYLGNSGLPSTEAILSTIFQISWLTVNRSMSSSQGLQSQVDEFIFDKLVISCFFVESIWTSLSCPRVRTVNSTLLFTLASAVIRFSLCIWSFFVLSCLIFSAWLFNLVRLSCKALIWSSMKESISFFTAENFAWTRTSISFTASTPFVRMEAFSLAFLSSWFTRAFSSSAASVTKRYLWPWWSTTVQSRQIALSQLLQNSFSVFPLCFSQCTGLTKHLGPPDLISSSEKIWWCLRLCVLRCAFTQKSHKKKQQSAHRDFEASPLSQFSQINGFPFSLFAWKFNKLMKLLTQKFVWRLPTLPSGTCK